MTRRLIPAALALALSALPAAAKTFVFCSEGSPEALNPQLTTTTIGMDASRPIYNTLVEFVPGTLIAQLRPEGVLAAIERDARISRAMLYERTGQDASRPDLRTRTGHSRAHVQPQAR